MDELQTTEAPLAALTDATKEKVALMLNGHKILPSADGLQRDWRGVAQCLDCDNDVLQQLGRAASPAAALLERCRGHTVSAFWCALRTCGRLDVQDDTAELIASDVSSYEERLLSPVSSSSAVRQGQTISDQELLCVGDAECMRAGRPLPTFDAFLLYDDDDVGFAAQIIQRMEQRGIKLCDKERHLLPGVTFEHQGIIRLMETRCHRVLAVLSPRFLQSEVNRFLAMFAQALGLDKRGRVLLPCVYEKCTLPSYLMYCSRIDFTRGVGLVNAWDKMYETLSVTMATRARSVSYSVPDAPPVAPSARARTESSPCTVSPPSDAAETAEGAASATEPQRVSAGRGLFRRIRGRLRGSEEVTVVSEPELELDADGEKRVILPSPPTTEPSPPKRSQLSKLFGSSKDKEKAKSKKKVALVA